MEISFFIFFLSLEVILSKDLNIGSWIKLLFESDCFGRGFWTFYCFFAISSFIFFRSSIRLAERGGLGV